MGFLDVVGELTGFSDNKGWSLTGDDVGFEDLEFKGQFIAENYNESGGGANLGENKTLNKQEPNYQWLYGEGEISTFTTRIFASNSFRNIKQQVELLRSFKKRDPDLKRAPKFLFTMGTEIEYTCFVKDVRFQFEELRSDGSLRGAIATITLQKLADTFQGTTNAETSLASQIKFAAGVVAGAAGIVSQVKSKINIPGGSLHTLDRKALVKHGQTFESIAQAEYGNAILGDVLRRAQPEKANLQAGDEVILLDKVEINNIIVTPQSTALKQTPENLTLKESFFEKKNKSRTIFI